MPIAFANGGENPQLACSPRFMRSLVSVDSVGNIRLHVAEMIHNRNVNIFAKNCYGRLLRVVTVLIARIVISG